jgi:hypothetical protein
MKPVYRRRPVATGGIRLLETGPRNNPAAVGALIDVNAYGNSK